MKPFAESQKHPRSSHPDEGHEPSPLSNSIGLVHVYENAQMPAPHATAKITEDKLRDYLARKLIRTLNIIRMPDEGNYRVLVTLTFTAGAHLLTTARNKPRVWASLDRLMAHIFKNYGTPSGFSLVINFQHPKVQSEPAPDEGHVSGQPPN